MNPTTKSPLLRLVALILFIGLVIALIINLSSPMRYHGSEQNQPKITVSGTGSVFAVPTTATFTATINQTAATVQEAQTKATDQANKVLAYLKSKDIPETDIKTTDYSINPHYDYSNRKQVLTGYDVSESIQIKVADQSKAGDILGGVGNLGVQNVSGLSLTIDDQDALFRQAREKAIADAKTKASQLADDLGVRLGKIIDFQENNSVPGPIMYSMDKAMLGAGASAPSTPTISPGQNKYTSNVTITYEIR